jgi:hypothetical protein
VQETIEIYKDTDVVAGQMENRSSTILFTFSTSGDALWNERESPGGIERPGPFSAVFDVL